MWYYSISFALGLLQEAASPDASPGSAHRAEAGWQSGVLIWTLLGIVIGIVIGLLISLALRKPKNQPERLEQAQPPQINTPPMQTPLRRAASHARRCPVCNSTYTDEALIYCVSDGASLVPVVNNPRDQDPGATLLYHEGGNRDVSPTVPYRPDETQR
jgi:mannitol-specific phosphotransferase system IIBC component